MGGVEECSACVPGKGQASIGRPDHHFWHALARSGHETEMTLRGLRTTAQATFGGTRWCLEAELHALAVHERVGNAGERYALVRLVGSLFAVQLSCLDAATMVES